MNEKFYERKTGITADFIHDPAYVLSMLVNSLYKHYRQLFRRTD